MAESATLAKGISHQTLDPIGIEVDLNFKDKIFVRKFWIMKIIYPRNLE